jgi:aspartyl-tRNA(Asn)/glutamyl-tRNA(Gln) amidotransferase subunit A
LRYRTRWTRPDTLLGRSPVDIDADWRARRGLYRALDAGVARLKLGCLGEREREGIDAVVLARYDEAVERLRGLGATVVPFDPPLAYDDMKDGAFVIIAVEGYYHHGALYEDPDALVDEDVRPRFLAGRDLTANDYVHALRRREIDRAEFLAAIEGFDALLTPTVVTPPLPLDEVDQGDTPARFTRAANYLAICGLSVPAGLTDDGLPTSLQIMARGGQEATAIRVGAAFEAALGPLPAPPLSVGRR